MKKRTCSVKRLVLWILFGIVTFQAFYYVFDTLIEQGKEGVPFSGLFNNPGVLPLSLIPSLVLLILHACWTLGYRRGTLLLSLAFSLGFFFEVIGINTGTIFGGDYSYQIGASPVWLGVPLLVPVFWTAFIYAGYWLVSSLLIWSEIGKPNRMDSGRGWLILAICLDGLAVVAIDFIMDPLQVKTGNWIWSNAGAFYGVPLGNFFGWFLVTIIVTSIFRTIEYYLPSKIVANNDSMLMIPTLGYGLLGLGLACFSLKSGIPELSPIGILGISPFAFINLLLFRRSKNKTANAEEIPNKNYSLNVKEH
ncbi:MAG: carotenoid biosynthesis protein [Dehalococcoidales bacterium]|nr:carotenoid biosynthesis protein [Dehalococcoidales bacterium]